VPGKSWLLVSFEKGEEGASNTRAIEASSEQKVKDEDQFERRK